MIDGMLGEIALVITAVATLINAVSSYRNGRKLDVQDTKMNNQTVVLEDVQRATNGELAPKIAGAIVTEHKSEIASAIVEAARSKYIKQD